MRWQQKIDVKSKVDRPATAAAPSAERPTALKSRKRRGKKKPEKLSHVKKPPGMPLEEWQRTLRRQFGREQEFAIKNVGDERWFSEFAVTNPKTRRTYTVRIRGANVGDNDCTCADFATNTLGTCKHIEFTLGKLLRKREGKKALQMGHQPRYSEIRMRYGAQREISFRPGSDCSKKLARLASEYFDAEGVLLPDAALRFETFLAALDDLDDDVRCYDDVKTYIAGLRDDDRRRHVVAEALPRGIRSPLFKDLLKVNLYDYQREGVLFAVRAGRCLLGDDMGLGKTVQAVATAELMAKLFGISRVLVVAPTSLKHQWDREIKRLTDRTTEVLIGARPRRLLGFRSDTFFKITNYDTVHVDLDLIAGWAPDLVILDEAQRIKNWNTRTARSVKRIDSPYAVVLTGTPLENRLEELISIVQFVDLHRLGPTFRLLDEHQRRDQYGMVVGYKDLDTIGKTLEPILLRRHKKEVLDQLPERIDQNVFVPMTPQQRDLHTEAMESVARIVQKWRQTGFLSEVDKQKLMIFLQRMRMACDSTYLVDHVTDFGSKADEIVTVLDEVLQEPESKVVVFSQWNRMHELLIRRIAKRGWGHVLFNGSVPSGRRGALIDTFRDDPNCRLFLSTDSGGTGLNLQHASMVVNVDVPWNPAVLEQRIARVHRLGQKRTVRVVNFVSKGSIEEGMLDVIRFKRSLFAGVLDGGEKDVQMGGSKLKRFMETVEKVTTSIPDVTIEEADAAYGAPESAEAPPPESKRGRPAGSTSSRRTSPVPVPADDHDDLPEPTPAPAAPSDALNGLLQMGLSFLQQMTSAPVPPSPTSSAPRGPSTPAPLVHRDERTGEAYLRLPMPSQDAVEQLLKGLGTFLERLNLGSRTESK